ncbi:sodium/hydrogen exchanger 2 [Pangasianodon hypophthalmus]|uniref:sodium/hydrogen exchanger 2 n=1 Tax=Pangasianodon hypophthalmus TaxID=310915 RepID=UPI0023081AB5|nr:sodium/hydrogen exchanger 2 [Pangasianodon hypophthalmus]
MVFLLNSKTIFIFLISWSLLALLTAGAVPSSTTSSSPSQHPPQKPVPDAPHSLPAPEKTNLPVFVVNYPYVQIPFEITLWVLLASFAKIGFHVYHKITIWIPETCLLIAVGLIVGGIMHSVHEEPPAVLTSSVFFLYMLPPIVLDSAYFMPTRAFFENVGTVMWFSVVGTLWNSIGVGISLFGICQIQAFGIQDITMQENLLFASIIAAVDPVAVLTVFEDVNIHEQLYIVVFGESLFNDAVTVVLYNLFNHVAILPVVDVADVFLAVARFFVIFLGGIFFGFLFGFVAAFTTRFTWKVREIEPLFIFMYSYLAYLLAELLSVSSIMAIVTCALTMKYYVEENVSQRSCTTIRHTIKMLGTVSETLIFFFLGVVTITTDHEWNWGYIFFTLLFAQLWRTLGILVMTQIINPFRTIPFNYKDQFGLAYGGLRGAVTFALAFTLPETILRKKLFVTTCIAVIIFTVFIQGISMRPIIELMNVRKTNRDHCTINVEIHKRLMEHTIAGIEDLCGQWSHHSLKDRFMRFNNRYLRKILIRDDRAESSIVALYKKLELQNAMEILDSVSGDISAEQIKSLNEENKFDKPKKTLLTTDLVAMHEILSKNMYKIRERTVSYTNKHALPNDTRDREILMRRHTSIRRSLRPRRLQSLEAAGAPKYFSLPVGQSLNSRFATERLNTNGDADIEIIPSHPSARIRFRQPSWTPSMPMTPLRKLEPFKETVVDEISKEQKGYGSSRSSSATSSRLSAPHWRTHHRTRDYEHEREEQHTVSPPTVWSPEPPERGTGEARNPLLQRPQWEPQDQRGQQK